MFAMSPERLDAIRRARGWSVEDLADFLYRVPNRVAIVRDMLAGRAPISASVSLAMSGLAATPAASGLRAL